MKNLFTIFALILCAFASPVFAQEKAEWIRIESGKKEVSVSLPPDFIVNAEPESYRKQTSIYGSFEGVEMSFRISKPENPKQTLKTIRISEDSDEVGVSFEINGLKGKNVVTAEEKIYRNTFFLASEDYFYQISVTAKLNSDQKIIQTSQVAHFINSVKVRGQQLIVPDKQSAETENTIIASSSLKSSPVVLEALKTKDAKIRKIKYETSSDEKPTDYDKSYSRQLIILRRPFPSYSDSARQSRTSGTVKLKVLLQANGEIGDITVLSRLDQSLEYNAVNAASRIKFLPAEVDGKPVDVFKIITYSFAVY